MTIMLKILTGLLLSIGCLMAADPHAEHAKKTVPGPQGGKIIEVENGHAEFLVQPDRKVRVTFYSEEMKALPPGDQNVKATAQAPTGSSKLEFEKTSKDFISKETLPAGDGYLVVLQIKSKPEAKVKNTRIKLDLANCGECKRAEYACTCDGHGH